jgi:predicted transcriptional regulator YheO
MPTCVSTEKSMKGYCVKYDPQEILAEYNEMIRHHCKSEHAVSTIARRLCKSRRSVYRIIKAAQNTY